MTAEKEGIRKPTVLIVDDTPDNLALMSAILAGEYRTKVATSGEKALALARSATPPDLILLDVIMPGLDGYEVCRALKEEPTTARIPVIFLTARSDAEAEAEGLSIGAVDYIAKPVSPPIVLARVRNHLQLKSLRDFLEDKNEYLESEVERRSRELGTIQDVTMVAMGSLAETRDNETGKHIRRTQHYVRELASRLIDHPRFRSYLAGDTMMRLFKSAPLHDIGKIGIPDRILLKPERLDPEEFQVMKTHTTIGRNAIQNAEKLFETPYNFLILAREIAYSHHERWDGSGYPDGIAGETIPAAGRIMAVADVYDALRSRRVYKPAMRHEEAVAVIETGAGSQFDPDIVAAFKDVAQRFREIADSYLDD